ncbi:MAG: AMP-binding protein, partial [Vicinamibacterales bacterium]
MAPIWTPSPERIARANLTRFIELVNRRHGLTIASYGPLYEWSCSRPLEFWSAVWDFAGIRGSKGERAAVDVDRMDPGARFFPDATLNFAENALAGDGDAPAIVFRSESGLRRNLSWRELRVEVAAFAAALSAMGVRRGDRVAGYLPNLPETVVAALGASSIGAVWSSCSPDFGVQGLVDRFGQIEPRVLVCADGYVYGGKAFDSLARVRDALDRLPTVERTVVVPYAHEKRALDGVRSAAAWSDFVGPHTGAALAFEPLPFNHPLYILYSSGTTGVPKCIGHGAGGTLIPHLKEHQLHCDIHAGDRVCYFTTCGWMMWNWLVTALASRAAIL